MRVTSRAAAPMRTRSRSRLRFSPEFAPKVADTIEPGTTVIVTDQPVVRKREAATTTYFAS